MVGDANAQEASLKAIQELMSAPDFPASIPRYMRTHATDREKLGPLRLGIALACSSAPRFSRLLDDGGSDDTGGGTCAGICDAMRAFPDDSELQRCALGAIIGMSSSNPVNMQRLGEAGACVCACDASRRFVEDAGMQRDAIWAMAHLAAEDDDNRTRLANEGSVELLVGTMTRFPDDAKLQRLGCTAIMNLTNRTSDCDEALGEAGACEAVCGAMRSFARDGKVIPMACGAVRNLSNNTDNARRLTEAGVCELLAAALSPPEAEEEEVWAAVLREACWAVASLAAHDDVSMRQLGEQGVCERVCSAMRRFAGDRGVQFYGRAAVKSLSADETNARRLEAAGLCDILHPHIGG